MKFSDKLAKMRKANNLSQEQLAEMLGVTRQSVSKWESGETYPDMAKIIQICKVLNCKLNDILEDGLIDEEVSPKKETALEKDGEIIKKYLDSFLFYVTKTYNMFIHMSFKEKLKMLFEMVFIGLLLVLAISLIMNSVETLLYRLLYVVTSNAVRDYICLVITSICTVALTILALIVFFHLFKIRYLDYYVTLTDDNVSKQQEEKPIEENKSAFNDEPKVIIRDPKHSSSFFFSGLGKIFMFIVKAMLVIISMPIIFVVLVGIGALFFFLFSKSPILASSSLILIGGILFGFMLLLVIFNILFNHKQQYIVALSLLVLSLTTCGIGFGSFGNKVMDVDPIRNYEYEEKYSKVFTIDDFKQNDTIFVETHDIEFVINENKKNIEIEFIYPKFVTVYDEMHTTENNGNEYYFGSYTNDFSAMQQVFEDLKSNQIHESYNSIDYIKVKVTCNSKNKELFAHLAY